VSGTPTQELIYLLIALLVFGVFQFVLSFYNVVLAILAAFTRQRIPNGGRNAVPPLRGLYGGGSIGRIPNGGRNTPRNM